MDVPAVRAAATRGQRWSGCAAPTTRPASPEPEGAIEALLAGLEADAAADGRAAPVVVVDEAYSEFDGSSRDPAPRPGTRTSSSSGRRQQGLRAGRPARRVRGGAPGDARPRSPSYRPPGSVGTISVDRRGRRAARRVGDARQRRPRRAASARASPPASRPPAGVPGRRSPTSSCSTSVTAERSEAAALALMRRGPRPAHVRAGHPLAPLPPGDRPRPRRERPPGRRGRRDLAHAPLHRGGASGMTTPLGTLESSSATGRRVRVARRTRETDITIALDLDGTGRTAIATGIGFYDHLLGSLAHHGLFDLEIRATGDLAGRRAPHRRGRGARARRGVRRGARRPGGDPALRRQLRADGRVGGDRGHRRRRAPVRRHRPAVPGRAGRDAAAPARRARPRVVRADRRAPRSTCAAPAATTTTWPRRRSRRSAARSGSPASRIRAGPASPRPRGRSGDRGIRRAARGRRRLRRRQPRVDRAGAHDRRGRASAAR